MAQFFGHHQGFAQVVAVLFFSSVNLAVKSNKSFDDGRIDAVHVADDGVGNDVIFQAGGKRPVASKDGWLMFELWANHVEFAPVARRENDATCGLHAAGR